MTRLISLLLVSGGSLAFALPAQNAKVQFNTAHASGETRVTQSGVDTIYAMQPELYRIGHGRGTGVRVTLRDGNAATAEKVTVGFVELNSAGTQPDPTRIISQIEVTMFGSGSGAKTMDMSVLLTTPVTLPARSAQLLVLPAPRSGADMVEVRYQSGFTLKLPTGVTKDQQSFFLQFGFVRAFLGRGTILQIGGIYEEALVGTYNRSTGYGPAEDLFGPEALYFDTTRGDQLGLWVQSKAHANQLAVIGMSLKKAATPFPTPYGPVLIDPFASYITLPGALPLDSSGYAKTPSVPLPTGFKIEFWLQGVFLNFTQLTLRTGDACGFRLH